MQRLHLVGLLGPAFEGGFPLVAGYGSDHYGRFLKDLGRALRCRLILCAPHGPVAFFSSGSLYTLTMAPAGGRRIDQRYDSFPGQLTHAGGIYIQHAHSEGLYPNGL
jgi:hypothetical protein